MLDVLIFYIKEHFSENQLSILWSLESLVLNSFSLSEQNLDIFDTVTSFYNDDWAPEKLKS